MDTADITEQQLHEKGQYQQDFDLIEGGICFVLADGSERVVFANRKAALLYECEDAESFLQFCAGNYQNLIEEEDYKPLSLCFLPGIRSTSHFRFSTGPDMVISARHSGQARCERPLSERPTSF